MGDADLGEAELDDAELDAAGPDRVGPDGAELDEVELGAAGRRVGLDGVLTAGAGRTGEGRAAHQGPEVDGSTTVTGLPDGVRVGDLVSAKVVASDGVDLIAEFAALVSTPDARPAANLTA
ncbi:hypothetical protein [Kribbella pratensis]